jgi:hypothetical protein
MKILTINDVQQVSGGNWSFIGSMATSTIGGLVSGSYHKNWKVSVTVDALLNGAVAYFMAPAAIFSTVGFGMVAHTIAYLGAEYVSSVE